MEDMFRDSESETDSETRDPDRDKENRLQKSVDSFVEDMDVDIENWSVGSNNERNGERVTQRKSLDGIKNISGISDESGVDLESHIQRRALAASETTSNSVNNEDNSNEEGSVDSGTEISSIVHSTSRTSRTRPGAIKLPIPLSIFKIDLEKVDEAIDREDRTKIGITKNNKARIDFMIEAANPKRKRKRGQVRLEPESYELRPYPCDSYVNAKFELLFYQKVTHSTDEETNEKNKKTHKIRFLHKTDSHTEEIFALPSGSGRNVVLQWTDTNFPSSIASATLDPKSVTEKEVKNLYENRYLSRFKMKKGESLRTTPEFHLRFAPQVYTKYHANINGVNEELKNILGHCKMQVKLESITFPSAVIDMNEYSELCGKLSEIYSNPNLPRSREFDGYLSKVSKKRNTELDHLLRTELEQFFRLTSTPPCDNVFGKLKHFIITQKDSTRYFESTNFRIYYKNKMVISSGKPPQLHELHTVVNKHLLSNSFDSFSKRFDLLKISTPSTQGGEREIKEKFFNCLEGVLYDDVTKRNYWRVNSNWFQVTGRYSFDIYAEYIRVLKTSLLEKCDCSLRFLWPLVENRPNPKDPSNELTNRKGSEFRLKIYRQKRFVIEGIYNNLYTTEPYFTVTDSAAAPFGVEICDLFQYVMNADGKPTIYLYYVKKAFGADGYRAAICQTLSAVYYLHDSFTNKGSTDSAAYKLFNFVKDNQKETALCKDYDEFLDMLRHAQIVFAPLFESGERDLDKDYMARLRYDFSDFEDCIDSEFREDLKNELESFLINSEYIYPDKDFTQKWYDTCAVPRDKGFHVLNDRGRNIDPFPSRHNLDSKQLRRILKEKYYRTVDGLAIKQLIVYLSEVLNFMGFGFKICQIEGAGDAFLPN